MSPTDDDSDLFPRESVSAAAETHAVDDEELAAALADHQASVERLPGVENLAYEWRKQYESPLVERTTDAYYFAVPERVWDEFADALDVRDAVRDALVDVHRRTVVDRTGVAAEPPGDRVYVALDRTVGDVSPP